MLIVMMMDFNRVPEGSIEVCLMYPPEGYSPFDNDCDDDDDETILPKNDILSMDVIRIFE